MTERAVATSHRGEYEGVGSWGGVWCDCATAMLLMYGGDCTAFTWTPCTRLVLPRRCWETTAVPAPSFTCLSLKLGADVMTHLLINYSCLIICNETKPKEEKEQSWRLLCFDKSNWLCITAAYQAFNHSRNLKWDMKNLNSLHESSCYLSSLARLNRNHSVCIYTCVPCVEYNACPACWDRKFTTFEFAFFSFQILCCIFNNKARQGSGGRRKNNNE